MYNAVEFYKDGKRIHREEIDVKSLESKTRQRYMMNKKMGYCRDTDKSGSLDLKSLASKTFPDRLSDFKNLCKVKVNTPGTLCHLKLGKKNLVLNLHHVNEPENWKLNKDKNFKKMMNGMPKDIKKMTILDRTSYRIVGCFDGKKLGKVGNGFVFDDQFAGSKGIYGLGDHLTQEMILILGDRVNSDILFKKRQSDDPDGPRRRGFGH